MNFHYDDCYYEVQIMELFKKRKLFRSKYKVPSYQGQNIAMEYTEHI